MIVYDIFQTYFHDKVAQKLTVIATEVLNMVLLDDKKQVRMNMEF